MVNSSNRLATMPKVAHDVERAYWERVNRRQFIIIIILLIAFIATNAYWIWNESQYEDQVITQTVTQDSGDGGANTYSGNVIGGDYNGEADHSDYSS